MTVHANLPTAGNIRASAPPALPVTGVKLQVKLGLSCGQMLPGAPLYTVATISAGSTFPPDFDNLLGCFKVGGGA